MSKTFRSWDVEQARLLPPSVHEFVPAEHLAHFVRDTVREGLDLSAIVGVYVLCTLNAASAGRPQNVYRFFHDELGVEYIPSASGRRTRLGGRPVGTVVGIGRFSARFSL